MNTANFLRGAVAASALLCATLLTSCTTPSANIDSEPMVDASKFPRLDQLPGKVPPTVWNGLSNHWASRHVGWTNAANDDGAVVFLGDSITEGWSTLAKDFPKMKVANRGISGDISSGVLYRLRADVLRLHPEAIVLLIGTNDVGDGADGEDVAANIRLILQAIKKYYPNEKVIVCKIMPRSDGTNPQLYAQNIQKANALIEAYVTTQKNCAICDTWSIFADANGLPNPADFRPDHLHLNAAGYVVWKSALDPVLAKMRLE